MLLIFSMAKRLYSFWKWHTFSFGYRNVRFRKKCCYIFQACMMIVIFVKLPRHGLKQELLVFLVTPLGVLLLQQAPHSASRVQAPHSATRVQALLVLGKRISSNQLICTFKWNFAPGIVVSSLQFFPALFCILCCIL